MDVKVFVQNIKYFCTLKGVKPTIACEDSGAGKNLINQIERRGSMPSIEKTQMLADYLGVTTSELLGETKEPTVNDITSHISGPVQPDLLLGFNQLSPDGQKEVLAFIEFKQAQERDKH